LGGVTFKVTSMDLPYVLQIPMLLSHDARPLGEPEDDSHDDEKKL